MKFINLTIVSIVIFALSTSVSAGLTHWPTVRAWSFSNFAESFKTVESNVKIEDCSDESYVFSGLKVEVDPGVVKAGDEVNVKISGTLHEEIFDGTYYDVDIKLGYIKLIRKTFDFCQEIKNDDRNKVECPLAPGDFVMYTKLSLSEKVPPAQFLVDINAYTAEDRDLLCIKARAKIPAKEPQQARQQDLSQDLPLCAQLDLQQALEQALQQDAPQDLPLSAQLELRQALEQALQQDAPQDLPLSAQLELQQALEQALQQDAPQDLPLSAQLELQQALQQALPQDLPQDLPQSVQQYLQQSLQQFFQQDLQQSFQQVLQPAPQPALL